MLPTVAYLPVERITRPEWARVCFGLTADRVDTAAGMITVSQQVIIADRQPVLASPKTAASIADT
jgi:hypothetical protein